MPTAEEAAKDWRNSLPEEMRAEPVFKDIPDIATLAKSFRDTKAFVGSSIRKPSPEAGPEAQKEFLAKLRKMAPELMPAPSDTDVEGLNLVWEKLGRPTDEKGYEFTAPEGVDINLDKLRADAKKLGLTKSQFKLRAEAEVADRTATLEATKADSAALKTEWGQAYSEKLKAASNIAKQLKLPDALVTAIAEGKMSSSQLKAWDAIAKAIGPGEGSQMASQTGTSATGALTPAEAMLQYDEIMARPDRAFWDKRHPLHNSLVAKAKVLMEMTNG